MYSSTMRTVDLWVFVGATGWGDETFKVVNGLYSSVGPLIIGADATTAG
jgi:hypothetical protein